MGSGPERYTGFRRRGRGRGQPGRNKRGEQEKQKEYFHSAISRLNDSGRVLISR